MLFAELNARGLIKQITNEQKVRELLDNSKTTFYIGFDPTADSLHVGHLLQLILAKRLIDRGHKAILLIGGATASVGDPTGKTDMRKMLSVEEIAANGECFKSQFQKIVGDNFEAVNNLVHFQDLGFLDLIREVGVHFSVNNMLRAECFKARMEHGLSFLEFNYMIMQSFDFLRLHETHGCTLQIGGDDQWSNMLGGIDLIRKKVNAETFAFTLPLLTNSAGQKMGKTEKGAVWLDSNKTSVNDFFQFWRNIADAEVKKCFNFLTFVSVDEINQMPFTTNEEMNVAKKRLAFEITRIVHGEESATQALNQAEALFEKHDTSNMEVHQLEDNLPVLEVIVRAGFARSKTEARNLINGKGISVNDKLIDNVFTKVSSAEFGSNILLRKGKKSFIKFSIS